MIISLSVISNSHTTSLKHLPPPIISPIVSYTIGFRTSLYSYGVYTTAESYYKSMILHLLTMALVTNRVRTSALMYLGIAPLSIELIVIHTVKHDIFVCM